MPASHDSTAGPVSGDTLSRAVAQGVLTPQQVEMLRYLEKTRTAPNPTEPQDDETFRFISGFSDIFVTIGLGLFLGALGYFFVVNNGSLASAGIVLAAASWLLAEYFTRRKRLALPSIVLLLVYSASVFVAIAEMLNASHHGGVLYSGWRGSVAGLIAAAASAIHYWRFRVPITIAAGAAGLVSAILSLLFAVVPNLAKTTFFPLMFLCGLAVFALAMRFDLSDPRRQTRRTDIAFWLQMLAAPLIVHSLVSGLFNDGAMGTASALGILAIFVLLALVALIVDRRAILVSGLSYAGFAFGSLVMKAGIGDGVVPLTMLVLGALVLLLSAGWHALRRRLLPLLPEALVRRLPPHT